MYTLAVFELGIFSSGGERDARYATTPGLTFDIIQFAKK
jgi:hypothetical protein